jgi:hypothetical protein
VPEETIKFGHETMYLYTWAQRRQYAAFKELLGPGINLHLKVCKHILLFGPVIALAYKARFPREQLKRESNLNLIGW